MSVIDALFGRPLRSSDESSERLGAAAGIPVFGLDALSSAAYGPEAALTLLIPLSVAGVAYIVPITISIAIDRTWSAAASVARRRFGSVGESEAAPLSAHSNVS